MVLWEFVTRLLHSTLWIFGVQVYLILRDGLFKEIWVGELWFGAISHNLVDELLRRNVAYPNFNNSLVQMVLMLSLFGTLVAMRLLFYFGYVKWR